MAKPNIIEETPINMGILESELAKIKKRDEELNFRANKTIEYLHNFKHLKKKNADELQKEIEELKVPRMKPNHTHKIIDTLPKTLEELKVVLQGYPLTVKQDDMKRIVSVVKKYI